MSPTIQLNSRLINRPITGLSVFNANSSDTLQLSTEDTLLDKVLKLKSSVIGRESSNKDKVIIDGFVVGEKIGGKIVLNEIEGNGGFGTIFQAYMDDKLVAVKTLTQGKLPKEIIDRFKREAEVMANLQHPNIVSLLDVGVDAGRPYIVMEYAGEGTLEDVIRAYQKRKIGLSTALHYIADLCSALGKVHEDGQFVHRDIAPKNILLSSDKTNEHEPTVFRNVIKLADFGLAQVNGASYALTGTNVVFGTIKFSPIVDMIVYHHLDARSDLYSVGIILYSLIRGKLPFDVQNEEVDDRVKAIRICDQHCYNKPDFSGVNENIPKALVNIVERLLSKPPDKRIQTAKELELRLREIASTVPVLTTMNAPFLFKCLEEETPLNLGSTLPYLENNS